MTVIKARYRLLATTCMKAISRHSLLLAIPTVDREIDDPGIGCGAFALGNLILHLISP